MEQRSIRYLIASLVALATIQMQAQAQQLPRLVVYITVDQLRSDYLEELSPLMGEQGLRRLMRQSSLRQDVKFRSTPQDASSATATLLTGVYPHLHGIERAQTFNRKSGRVQSIFWDEAFQGNYTRESYSPKALLVGTLGDRLKEVSEGKAVVYAIAPEAEQAFASAGLSADGCFWLDNKSGAWASSSFYGLMPKYIERYNRSNEGLNRRITSGKLSWTPLGRYSSPQISYADRSRSFSHKYDGTDVWRYKQSPLVNEEVTSLALQLLHEGVYDKQTSPSLLSLSYSASSTTDTELGAEEVDTYIRLDKQIERLLLALDKKVGLDNCLITLSGTGYVHTPKAKFHPKLRRQFVVQKAWALINMYLSALHGQGAWVETSDEGRIYLNHKLAEQKGVKIEQLQVETASVLRDMEGVASAVPASEVLSSVTHPDSKLTDLARSIHRRTSADVYWSLYPSWSLEDSRASSRLQTRVIPIASPFVLMGPSVEATKLPLQVHEATDIVRVICSILRIRPPNAEL